jgi:hypothetical protein
MADNTLLEGLLQKLAATNDPTEKAAIIAEATFDQQPPPVALVARRSIILRWFDATILAALLPALEKGETTLTAEEVERQLAQLPFVERLAGV